MWRDISLAHARGHAVEARATHWLDSLQMRVPGARVLLVVTHVDMVDPATLDTLCSSVKKAVGVRLEELRRAAGQGLRVVRVLGDGESVRVNCLLGNGVSQLREMILETARSSPWFAERLPSSFVAVKAAAARLCAEIGPWSTRLRPVLQDGLDAPPPPSSIPASFTLLLSLSPGRSYSETHRIRLVG